MHTDKRQSAKRFWKFFWKWTERLSSLFSMLGYVKAIGVGIIVLLSIGWYSSSINAAQTRAQLAAVQQQMDNGSAETVLRSYFFYIENGQDDKAWNLLTAAKKRSTPEGYNGF